jgi:hypothetical protein
MDAPKDFVSQTTEEILYYFSLTMKHKTLSSQQVIDGRKGKGEREGREGTEYCFPSFLSIPSPRSVRAHFMLYLDGELVLTFGISDLL